MTYFCPNCSEIIKPEKGWLKCPCGVHIKIQKKRPDCTPISNFRYKSNETGGKKHESE